MAFSSSACLDLSDDMIPEPATCPVVLLRIVPSLHIVSSAPLNPTIYIPACSVELAHVSSFCVIKHGMGFSAPNCRCLAALTTTHVHGRCLSQTRAQAYRQTRRDGARKGTAVSRLRGADGSSYDTGTGGPGRHPLHRPRHPVQVLPQLRQLPGV
ncbi:hypothetical protein VTI74DRAFT_11422 [Chaetomium olivicolor]